MQSIIDSLKQELWLTVGNAADDEAISSPAFTLIVAQKNGGRVDIDNASVSLSKNQAVLARGQAKAATMQVLGVHGALAKAHLSGFALNVPFNLPQSGLLPTTLQRIFSAQNPQDEQTALRTAFDLLLALTTYTPPQADRPALVQSAMDMMTEAYGFLYGIDDLADRLGVNKSHLIRVFRAANGITPGQFLADVRIAKAKQLLESGQVSLGIVAGLVGYANANYFGKVFRRACGTSPKAYASTFATKPSPADIPDEYYL